MRAGIGYDVHRLTAGRPLVLGGIRVPFDRGLEGHSDADVLVHAIVDAMLGALALGDIGQHFPDSDPRWKDASSLVFLEHARKLLAERGYRVVNVDAVILAQRPKLAAFLPQMAEQIARTLYLET
ncbi:MAG TPA: 2-C-methyl-D-erythritol 2,4-cyclodiphosphate synthase, partial [Bacteroidetes bacterium]|nr:2-C-methyl-D-erythritol 2,4-cyclodiphosphate synthase [Bacteroidota bacterium]